MSENTSSESEVVQNQNGDAASKGINEAQNTTPASDYEPVEVTIQSMLKAGAHFGHKTDRWNPKMLPFIFTQKSNVHIINLDMTMQNWEKARKFIVDISSRGGSVLFVGTKQQARKSLMTAAKRAGSFYVNNRWLGGMLSNFETIKKSLRRMKKLQELLAQADAPDSDVKLAKKERLDIRRQLERLDANLGGISEMRKHPDALFVVDINKESIAVAEARKLNIPVVALVDTNVDPKYVNFPIPANDDAARTIDLFVNAVADAVIEGRSSFSEKMNFDKGVKSDVEVQTTKKKSKDDDGVVASAASEAAV